MNVCIRTQRSRVVADASLASLTERGEIRHLMALPLPAAPPALAESAPSSGTGCLFDNDGHATGQDEGDQGDCHPRLGDTPNFREERALGKPGKTRNIPLRNDADCPTLEDQDSDTEAGSRASSDDTSRVAVVEDGDLGSDEVMPAILSNEEIPAAERLSFSDAMVYGTGASFNDGVSGAWLCEVGYGQLMGDFVILERASSK